MFPFILLIHYCRYRYPYHFTTRFRSFPPLLTVSGYLLPLFYIYNIYDY